MEWLIVASIVAVPGVALGLPAAGRPATGGPRGRRPGPGVVALVGAPLLAWFAWWWTESGYNPDGAPWPVALLPAAVVGALPLLRAGRPLALGTAAVVLATGALPPLLWEAGVRGGDFSECGGCAEQAGLPWEWREAMEVAGREDRRDYPAGWLEDSPLLAAYPAATPLVRAHLRTGKQGARWTLASNITGLWVVERGPAALWYPGGPLETGLKRVEYRSP